MMRSTCGQMCERSPVAALCRAEGPLPLWLGPQERGNPLPVPDCHFAQVPPTCGVAGTGCQVSKLHHRPSVLPRPGPEFSVAMETSGQAPRLASQQIALGFPLHPALSGALRPHPLEMLSFCSHRGVVGGWSRAMSPVSSPIAFQQDCHSSSFLSAPQGKEVWVG